MKLKLIALVFLGLSTVSMLKAADTNFCDELIASSNGSKAAEDGIKNCLENKGNKSGLGPSEYYKEQQALKNKVEKKEKIEEKNTKANQNNFEFKTFSKEELLLAGFGKPFYAVKSKGMSGEEEILTKGDSLCEYLGYEKSAKRVYSKELWENKPDRCGSDRIKVDKQGLVVDTWLGVVSKLPDIYRDEKFMYRVRAYEEITCARRKDKSIEGSKKALEESCPGLTIKLDDVPCDGTEINSGNRNESSGNRPTTEQGYVRPNRDEDQSSPK